MIEKNIRPSYLKTIEMPNNLADKWLAALRSGEYKQGPNVLHNVQTGTFCCLGVLQHCISGQVSHEREDELPSYDWLKKYKITFFNQNKASTNNPIIMEICDEDNYRILISASIANDTNVPFAEIAEAIEERLVRLPDIEITPYTPPEEEECYD